MTMPTPTRRRWSLLSTDIRDLFKRQGRLVDDEFLKELLGVLIKTDMGVDSARAICDEVGATFRTRVIRIEDLLASVKAKVNELMTD